MQAHSCIFSPASFSQARWTWGVQRWYGRGCLVSQATPTYAMLNAPCKAGSSKRRTGVVRKEVRLSFLNACAKCANST